MLTDARIAEIRERLSAYTGAFTDAIRADISNLINEAEWLKDDSEEYCLAAHYWREVVNTVPQPSVPMLWADVICHIKETYAEVERLRGENAEMRNRIAELEKKP